MATIPHIVRKWVKPEDLNQHGSLFGGSLLRWIDEEAAIYAILQIGNQRLVTKYISEIDFKASAYAGDLIELRFLAQKFGRTSITLSVEVIQAVSGEALLRVASIVFVGLDASGKPAEHGFSAVTAGSERIQKSHSI